jgi:hypothetical protein
LADIFPEYLYVFDEDFEEVKGVGVRGVVAAVVQEDLSELKDLLYFVYQAESGVEVAEVVVVGLDQFPRGYFSEEVQVGNFDLFREVFFGLGEVNFLNVGI